MSRHIDRPALDSLLCRLGGRGPSSTTIVSLDFLYRASFGHGSDVNGGGCEVQSAEEEKRRTDPSYIRGVRCICSMCPNPYQGVGASEGARELVSDRGMFPRLCLSCPINYPLLTVGKKPEAPT